MTKCIDFLCIGSLQYDILGRSLTDIRPGDDLPGSISRTAGGVAYRVAAALKEAGASVELTSVVGQDEEGAWLRGELRASGLNTSEIVTVEDYPSGSYLAIESRQRLIAAVADCRIIENCGNMLLHRAQDRFVPERFCDGVCRIVVDTNLVNSALRLIALGEVFAEAVLSVVVASNHKLEGVHQFAGRQDTTLYLNLEEANCLLADDALCTSSERAARKLVDSGFDHVVVTDGPRSATDCDATGAVTVLPRQTAPAQITGAGDRLAACHIVKSLAGLDRSDALAAGCEFSLNGVIGNHQCDNSV